MFPRFVVPVGMSLREIGFQLWGRGVVGAKERLQNITRDELLKLGLNRVKIETLRNFYIRRVTEEKGLPTSQLRVEFAALQDNRIMGAQPTVEDVVRQELEIAKDRVQRTNKSFPDEQIMWAQHAFDVEPELSPPSQENVMEIVAILAIELAPSFQRSEPATELLWHVVSRLVGTKGLFIGSPTREGRESVWSEHPGVLTNAIRKQSISVLPNGFTSLAKGRLARPQSFESESDPRPH